MTTRAAIDDFLAQKEVAVVGVSRKGNKFGNTVYRELKARGYRVFPINPHAETIEGDRCYPHVGALPKRVENVLVVVPPEETEKVVQDAVASGIRRVWMQQGAESEKAIHFCEKNNIRVVHGECILMFAQPTAFFHRMHRWVRGLLGKLPR